jgi:putative ABC transport system permease protein
MVKMNALNRKLLRDISIHRAQVLAISLVVACGIATFIAMRSNYNSLKESQQSYYRTYRFADLFVHLKRAPESVLPALSSIPGIARINTRIVTEVVLDIPGLEEPATARLVSIPDQPESILNDIYIRQGRYPEVSGSTVEVLVSEAFATANKLRTGEQISAVLNGRWKNLTISGIAMSPEYVYEIRGAEVLPDNRRFGVFWMNHKVLASLYNMESAFNDIAVTLSRGASQREIISALDRTLEEYGGLGAYGREEQISHNFIKGEIDETSITSTYIPGIFLGIAAFLLNIVLSRLVATQRNQVGLLKAFGYSNFDIGIHYLKFAFLSVAGGAILGSAFGLWAGAALGRVYTRFFHFPVFEYSAGADLLMVAFLISFIAAAAGAMGALRAAADLPPAEAMRPEAPASFRAGWLERFGIARFVSIGARMIARNIARRPVKAALSLVGIALAVAVMLVGLFAFDSLDHLMWVQFRTIQREDVTVLFEDPVGWETVHSLQRMPGVLKVEPFRMASARLRYAHASKRIGILGLLPDGDLRRVMDDNLKKFDLPPSGIILTGALAKQLHAQPGDVLRVEVLEGQRGTGIVTLTNTVEEPVGLSAYMQLSVLNQMLREAPAITGAYLSIDPNSLSRFYAEIKRTPVVAGVSIREAMLRSFALTIAESFRISLDLLIGFACVIAFSVIYNGARIALSERGHELASLRVLGFSKNEISWMLLGEQSLLLFAATPVGFLIGRAICFLISQGTRSDLYRLPVVISPRTYLFAFLVTFLSAVLSSIFVIRRIRRLDLVEVLKTRES